MSCKESVHEGSLTVLLELVVVLDRLYHHQKNRISMPALSHCDHRNKTLKDLFVYSKQRG